ncbi:hypothetical protein Dimus_029456 [Dionaea muscipula]
MGKVAVMTRVALATMGRDSGCCPPSVVGVARDGSGGRCGSGVLFLSLLVAGEQAMGWGGGGVVLGGRRSRVKEGNGGKVVNAGSG